MLVDNLEQGTQAWLDWRKSKIGASDIACILGKSKWSTAFELWQQKLGFTGGVKDNFAMKRGRELEPVVRDLFNKQHSTNFQPAIYVHDDLEWASASLDGIQLEDENLAFRDCILEIKCPGRADHQTAEQGQVPAHYFSQVQWQMFVSGTVGCFYVSYCNEDMVSVYVKLDEEYLTSILPTVAEFYRCVVEMREPELSEDDYVQITDEEFGEAAKEWKAAKELLDFYEAKVKFFKEKLVKFTDDSNSRGYGVSLSRISKNGSVGWTELWKDIIENFPEAGDQFDPEDYRKEQVGYWKVSKDKEAE